MEVNPLLCTDVYKMGHMEQYPEGTTKIYSYLQARSDRLYVKSLFFGLQYYLLKYLTIRPTALMVKEFLWTRQQILGVPAPEALVNKLADLVTLGYFPLEIKAVAEGSLVPVKNVLMTVTNTHPDYFWLVGFFESLLLKVWNTTTVATASRQYAVVSRHFAEMTCDNYDHVPFQVHDFGYRGCSSEETACVSSSAHLLNFLGSDTVGAVKTLKDYYQAKGDIALSVPASEHSVMCSFGRDFEYEAFLNMLKVYPTGIVSIVSDTYDLWWVLEHFAPTLKDQILQREGKVVFRPDSGDPVKIICGDDDAPEGTPARKGALCILADIFGVTINSKGLKVLNPKVGLIYGDGMWLGRFEEMLILMRAAGWASSNIVIGVGGILLQNHSRDDMGFAFKASYCEVNGQGRAIVKDPITDPSKKSHKGLMSLIKIGKQYVTFDELTWEGEKAGILKTVYKNGELVGAQSLDEIRALVRESHGA